LVELQIFLIFLQYNRTDNTEPFLSRPSPVSGGRCPFRFSQEDQKRIKLHFSDPCNITLFIGPFLSRSTKESGLSRNKKEEKERIGK